LKKNAIIVLYAGLLVPRKGIDKIIRIADALRNEDIAFVLAGDGPDRKKYELQIKSLGLEKKVFFLGWRTDIHKLYQASDIFLLPSEGEGLPGVVMEAASFGVPCVASDIPCIPDLIDDGKSGFLCPKGDVKTFASRIKKLAHDKALRARFSAESIKKIKRFDWDNVEKIYERLYDEICES